MCTEKQSPVCLDILPAFPKENVAVVFETSHLFIPYLSVAILSLIDHTTTDHNYDIIILSSETTAHDEALLQSMCCGRSNIRIRAFNPRNMVQAYIENAQYQYLEINYYRMSLPWILKHYTRVINLGADVLLKRNIADLFYEKMEDTAYVGGAVDLGYQGRLALDISHRELGLKNPFAYINADVLVLELDKIRTHFLQDEVMLNWQKRFFRCAEQDAINCLFQEHIHHIDLRWNLFPSNMSSEFDVMHAPASSVLHWKECLSQPYIIHYAAVPKPWQLPTVGYGVEWWYTAKRSPYFEQIAREMSHYLETHGEFRIVDSDVHSLTQKLMPHGSIRRKILKVLIPKGSVQWCLLKKAYYSTHIEKHRC